jgi:hypothetical protein
MRLAAGAGAIALLITMVVIRPGSGAKHNATAKRTGTGAGKAAVAQLPPVLLAQQDGAGNAVSLAVLAPAPSGKGGTLILVPPGTMAEVVSLGLQPVGKALQLGGPSRLKATAENLLGVPLGDIAAYDDNGLAALVGPAGPLSVRIPERVEQVNARGTVNVVYDAGPRQIAPNEVGALLSTKGSANDLSRLARHQAFFDAWLTRLKAQPTAIPAQPATLRTALTALVSGTWQTRVLPVRSLGTTTEDGELYQVDAGELHDLVVATFPGRPAATSSRIRMQILNGTGAVGLAQQVSDRLVPAGVEIKLTGNAGRLDYAQTEIVFYRPSEQAAAQRVQKALGVGKLVLSRNPLDVVDVTVIVGKDFH